MVFFNNKPSSKGPWTKAILVQDYRTNIHHSFIKNPLKLKGLREFITLYNTQNQHQRAETFYAETNSEGRWRKLTYEEIIARDNTSLDFTWLKDKPLAYLDNLPDLNVLAEDIIENLKAGLESFRTVLVALEK